jgi:hypothetical protein
MVRLEQERSEFSHLPLHISRSQTGPGNYMLVYNDSDYEVSIETLAYRTSEVAHFS